MLDLETEDARAAGFVGTDPLRLTVSFDGGIGGYEADEMLIEGVKAHTLGKQEHALSEEAICRHMYRSGPAASSLSLFPPMSTAVSFSMEQRNINP